jgi:predicted ATPase
VLNDLQHHAEAKGAIVENLKAFYKSAIDITARLHGGLVHFYIHERGMRPIPATRLSGGTMQYLCLLAVLCHPAPPPLICIEEPELGLHPDILPNVAELLRMASERTQLIVTTHSDALVSALSETADSVVICERDKSGSQLRRLDADKLKTWLTKYNLGELWRMGEIGGNP